MTKRQFMYFEQLIADIESENDLRQNSATPQTPIAVRASGYAALTFDDFSPAQPPLPLTLPSRPVVSTVEVGSRLTLLSRRSSESPGYYDSHLMLVLSVEDDRVQGYLIAATSSMSTYRCETVSKAQIIECLPPLKPGEEDLWAPIDDDIPF